MESLMMNSKKLMIFDDFFSVITKNSNWEILPKKLVTFKS